MWIQKESSGARKDTHLRNSAVESFLLEATLGCRNVVHEDVGEVGEALDLNRAVEQTRGSYSTLVRHNRKGIG